MPSLMPSKPPASSSPTITAIASVNSLFEVYAGAGTGSAKFSDDGSNLTLRLAPTDTEDCAVEGSGLGFTQMVAYAVLNYSTKSHLVAVESVESMLPTNNGNHVVTLYIGSPQHYLTKFSSATDSSTNSCVMAPANGPSTPFPSGGLLIPAGTYVLFYLRMDTDGSNSLGEFVEVTLSFTPPLRFPPDDDAV